MLCAVIPDDVPASSVGSFLVLVDLAGVLANGILGAVLARAARLDLIGVVVLAMISGTGGGIIRDVLLAQGPPVALVNYNYLLTALAGAVFVLLLPLGNDLARFNGTLNVIDAIALGSWAAVGALKTLEAGLGWLPAVLLGTITATGGGVVRDVLMNRIPAVLGGLNGTTLYATCAIVAAGTMIGFQALGVPNAGLLVSTVVGASLVLVARMRNWMLPVEYEWVWRRPAQAGARAGRMGVAQLKELSARSRRVAARAARAEGKMQSVHIRLREQRDLPELYRVLRRVYAADGYPVQGVAHPARWLAIGERDLAWTALVDNKPVGQVALVVPRGADATRVTEFAVDVDPAHVVMVSRLFVDGAARGLGASTALLDEALAHAQHVGSTVMLNCMDKDVRAMGMYERRGARRVGRTTHTLAGGEAMPCWWYQFGLPPRADEAYTDTGN